MERSDGLDFKLNKIREAVLSYTKSVAELEVRLSKTVYHIKSLEQNVKYLTKDGTVPFSEIYKATLKNLKTLESSCETIKKILEKEKSKLDKFKREEQEMLGRLDLTGLNNVIYLNKGKKNEGR